jgi:beta-glucosidase
MMLGNYNGTPSHTVTILEGIRNAYPEAEVTYERGCDLVEGYVYVDPRLKRGFRAENYEGLSAEQMAEIQKMEKERQALLAAAPKPIPSENYTPEALAEFAARTAEGTDVIFFVGGLAPTVEGEEMKVALDGFKGGDREKIELPEIQGGCSRLSRLQVSRSYLYSAQEVQWLSNRMRLIMTHLYAHGTADRPVVQQSAIS